MLGGGVHEICSVCIIADMVKYSVREVVKIHTPLICLGTSAVLSGCVLDLFPLLFCYLVLGVLVGVCTVSQPPC